MAGNKGEQEIIQLYNEDIGAAYSINEIATLLKKDYPFVHRKVCLLMDEGILQKKIVGRSHLCSINLQSDEAIFMLAQNEAKKKKQLLKSNVQIKKAYETILKMKDAIGIRTIVAVGTMVVAVSRIPSFDKISGSAIVDESVFQELIFNKIEKRNGINQNNKIIQKNEITVLYGFEAYYEIIGKLRR